MHYFLMALLFLSTSQANTNFDRQDALLRNGLDMFLRSPEVRQSKTELQAAGFTEFNKSILLLWGGSSGPQSSRLLAIDNFKMGTKVKSVIGTFNKSTHFGTAYPKMIDGDRLIHDILDLKDANDQQTLEVLTLDVPTAFESATTVQAARQRLSMRGFKKTNQRPSVALIPFGNELYIYLVSDSFISADSQQMSTVVAVVIRNEVTQSSFVTEISGAELYGKLSQ